MLIGAVAASATTSVITFLPDAERRALGKQAE